MRQLKAQANILVLALALSNTAALARQPLHVVGTVAVAAGVPKQAHRQYWERLKLVVGHTKLAPMRVPMRVRIQG